jgi:hypothetical protein
MQGAEKSRRSLPLGAAEASRAHNDKTIWRLVLHTDCAAALAMGGETAHCKAPINQFSEASDNSPFPEIQFVLICFPGHRSRERSKPPLRAAGAEGALGTHFETHKSLKRLKTAMSGSCQKLAWIWVWRHVGLGPAPSLRWLPSERSVAPTASPTCRWLSTT